MDIRVQVAGLTHAVVEVGCGATVRHVEEAVHRQLLPSEPHEGHELDTAFLGTPVPKDTPLSDIENFDPASDTLEAHFSHTTLARAKLYALGHTNLLTLARRHITAHSEGSLLGNLESEVTREEILPFVVGQLVPAQAIKHEATLLGSRAVWGQCELLLNACRALFSFPGLSVADRITLTAGWDLGALIRAGAPDLALSRLRLAPLPDASASATLRSVLSDAATCGAHLPELVRLLVPRDVSCDAVLRDPTGAADTPPLMHIALRALAESPTPEVRETVGFLINRGATADTLDREGNGCVAAVLHRDPHHAIDATLLRQIYSGTPSAESCVHRPNASGISLYGLACAYDRLDLVEGFFVADLGMDPLVCGGVAEEAIEVWCGLAGDAPLPDLRGATERLVASGCGGGFLQRIGDCPWEVVRGPQRAPSALLLAGNVQAVEGAGGAAEALQAAMSNLLRVCEAAQAGTGGGGRAHPPLTAGIGGAQDVACYLLRRLRGMAEEGGPAGRRAAAVLTVCLSETMRELSPWRLPLGLLEEVLEAMGFYGEVTEERLRAGVPLFVPSGSRLCEAAASGSLERFGRALRMLRQACAWQVLLWRGSGQEAAMARHLAEDLLNAPDAHCLYAAVGAAGRGGSAEAHALLQHIADLPEVDVNTCTQGVPGSCLRLAAGLGDVRAVELLLDMLADPDERGTADEDSAPALLLGVRSGNADVVRLLLEVGADAHASDCFGNTALQEALERGQPEPVTLLLAAGAASSVLCDADRCAALLAGAVQVAAGQQGIAAFLQGLQRCVADDPACEEDVAQVLRSLLDTHAAGLLPVRAAGFRCIVDGVHAVMPHVLQEALEAGRTSPRHTHASDGPLVRALLYASADGGGAESVAGVEVVFEALAHSAEQAGWLLPIEGGMQHQGDTLLGAVARNGTPGLLHALAERCDPDALKAALAMPDDSGHTPLIAAVQHGNLGMVQGLLQAGSPVNCQDPSGHTALHYATCRDDNTVRTLLLEAGAVDAA